MPILPNKHNEDLAGLSVGWTECAGSGPPLVLQHCSLASRRTWTKVLAACPARGYINADLPGHGETAHDPSRDLLDQAAAVLLELIDRADEPVHLVGHSFGAAVSLRVARDHPEKIASMMLYEPVNFAFAEDVGDPVFATELVHKEAFVAAMEEGREALSRHFMDRWGDGPFDELPDKAQAAVLKRIDLIPLTHLSLYGPPEGRVSVDDLPGIEVPTIVLAGMRSQPIMPVVAKVIADHMPNATLQLLEDAGHMGPITHPEVIAAALSAQM